MAAQLMSPEDYQKRVAEFDNVLKQYEQQGRSPEELARYKRAIDAHLAQYRQQTDPAYIQQLQAQEERAKQLESYTSTLNPLLRESFNTINRPILSNPNYSLEDIRKFTPQELQQVNDAYRNKVTGGKYDPTSFPNLSDANINQMITELYNLQRTDPTLYAQRTRAGAGDTRFGDYQTAVGPILQQIQQNATTNVRDAGLTPNASTTPLPGVTNIPGSTQSAPTPADPYETELRRAIANAPSPEAAGVARKELAIYQAQQADRTRQEAELKQYQDEQKTLFQQEQDRLSREARLEQAGASIGGVSPSELVKLRGVLEGTGPEGATVEQTLQDILGGRAKSVTEQTAGFEGLRKALEERFAKSREQLGTEQEAALGKFKTQAQSVQDRVMKNLLPQIQGELAARGLETGGGAFQSQAAKLATDLAADVEGQTAGQRLALETGRAELGRADTEVLANLQATQSEIARQQALVEQAQREGRLDQQAIQRLNDLANVYQQQLGQAGGREAAATGYQQQIGALNQQQAFAGLQSSFDRRQQDLARDLSARQFEQQLQFQNRQLNLQETALARRKPSAAESIGKILPTAAGTVIGGIYGGPAGATAGARIGGTLTASSGAYPRSPLYDLFS